MAASINLLGQLIVTDLNGSPHAITLNNAYPGGGTAYTVDSWQSFAIAAGSTTTVFDATSTGDVNPVSPWAVMAVFSSVNLLAAYGVDATAAGGLTSSAHWNNFPITANQIQLFWRNAFAFNYTGTGATNNVFTGTTTGVLLKMQVKELTAAATGTIQVITIT